MSLNSSISPSNEPLISRTQQAFLMILRTIGMDPKDKPHHSALPRASVLVPLFFIDKEPYILLTRRPMHLTSHPGEVCFPGGKQDEQDHCDDVQTALRETMEEIGLDSSHIEILCRCGSVESINHLCVTPVIGYIADASRILGENSLQANPTEVETIFHAPLALFAQKPVSEQSVEWSQEVFIYRRYKHVDSLKKKEYSITGLTAHVANLVAKLMFLDNNANIPVAAQTSCHCRDYSGYVWKKLLSASTSRPYWTRRFMVCDGTILHEYDTEDQARRKSNSANKKNRLLLATGLASTVTALPSSSSDKNEFIVSVMEGQIEWHLATATPTEQTEWIAILTKAMK